jgi:hypothetical protein
MRASIPKRSAAVAIDLDCARASDVTNGESLENRYRGAIRYPGFGNRILQRKKKCKYFSPEAE